MQFSPRLGETLVSYKQTLQQWSARTSHVVGKHRYVVAKEMFSSGFKKFKRMYVQLTMSCLGAVKYFTRSEVVSGGSDMPSRVMALQLSPESKS
jgi:ABC-type protease/lipase transport system fused ATPase/permease subunit